VTTEYEPYYSNLPEAFDGFRIVVLADIHDTEFGRDNKRLISRVNDASPDIIVIAGDILNAYANRRPVEEQLERVETLIIDLTLIAPVYFINGNHEISILIGGPEALESVLGEHGVRVLKDEYVILGADDSNILLIGIDAIRGWRKKQLDLVSGLRETDRSTILIVLEHSNDSLQVYGEIGVDLILCGHAHGGIIRLPFTDGLIGQNRDFLPIYTSGVYTIGDTKMLVSRGLGTTATMPRLLNNPQIAVAVLRSEKNIEKW